MTFEFNKLKGCIEKFKEERFTLLANVIKYFYIEPNSQRNTKPIPNQQQKTPLPFHRTHRSLIISEYPKI